jgi:hypoxanthine phosphoribosyltransferase
MEARASCLRQVVFLTFLSKEKMEKIFLDANEYLRNQWQLAAKIRSGGWRPDVIVGLWRGGASVAVSVHEFLRSTGWDVEHYPLKCSSYTAIGLNDGEVVFSFADEFFSLLKKGSKVLFVDDVFDTGKTAVAVLERAKRCGAEAKIACVYFKSAKNTTEVKPDYFVIDPGSQWLVFPHEMEGLSSLELCTKSPELASLVERCL